MKSETIIIICFITTLFSNCKKEIDEPEGNYFGGATIDINGKTVEFNKLHAGAINLNSDTINLSIQKWNGLILKESIDFIVTMSSINKIGIKQMIHKTNYNSNSTFPTSQYSTLSDDGDVLCDFYSVYEPDSLSNYITINSFNQQTKEIRGTFQVTYIRDMSRVKCRPTAPDTIRMKNGEFYTKIF